MRFITITMVQVLKDIFDIENIIKSCRVPKCFPLCSVVVRQNSSCQMSTCCCRNPSWRNCFGQRDREPTRSLCFDHLLTSHSWGFAGCCCCCCYLWSRSGSFPLPILGWTGCWNPSLVHSCFLVFSAPLFQRCWSLVQCGAHNMYTQGVEIWRKYFHLEAKVVKRCECNMWWHWAIPAVSTHFVSATVKSRATCGEICWRWQFRPILALDMQWNRAKRCEIERNVANYWDAGGSCFVWLSKLPALLTPIR